MSGFAGILNFDGAPVDPNFLDLLTRSMAFRGPDAMETWSQGPVGMGHTMLRTTWESAAERQPAGLDGGLRIVSDARIDARPDLIRELNAKPGRFSEVSLSTPDSELILHAYAAWGESCVEHFLGDFSFAIWDAKMQRLFCALDHFGVKSLYYARIGNAFIFSNTLDTVRLYPGCSPVLCDAAIADFLMFGMNLHPAVTPYEEILRVPRAHTLVASADHVRIHRFWSFPIEKPLRHRRSQEYVEQFRDLLNSAVKDRLRCDRASICLSGGLDSPAVAAEAVRQLDAPDRLLGITAGFDHLVTDPEPQFARIVADYLKIPWHFIAINRYKPFERWPSPELSFSQPADLTLGAMDCDFMDSAAEHGRVILTGEGGDPGLVPSLSFYRGPGMFLLLLGVGKYVLKHGHHPRIGFRVSWQRWRGTPPANTPNFPAWLNEEIVERLDLRDRWSEIMKAPPPIHPYRPEAYNSFNGPRIAFYATDGWRGRNVHVESRHPLLDVRIQRFFLRLPVLPWCADKEILRQALRGCLPKTILKRPKCPVQGNPTAALFREIAPSTLREFRARSQLRRYVNQDHIPDIEAGVVSHDLETDLRPINLNYWLSQNIGI